MKRTVEVGAGVGVEKEKGKERKLNSKKTRSVTKSNPQEVATRDAKCRNPLSKPALFPYKNASTAAPEISLNQVTVQVTFDHYHVITPTTIVKVT